MCKIDWKLIQNAEALIAALGDEPCFHDAPVMGSLRIGDSCEVTVHMFRPTGAIGPDGYFELADHHLVTLRMTGVHDSTLPEPYKDDTLGDVSLRSNGEFVTIEFESVLGRGFGASVRCRSIAVAKVGRCDSEGQAFS